MLEARIAHLVKLEPAGVSSLDSVRTGLDNAAERKVAWEPEAEDATPVVLF